MLDYSVKLSDCPLGVPLVTEDQRLSQEVINKISELIHKEVRKDSGVWFYTVELKISTTRALNAKDH
jgi:hypothetical protein